MTQTIRMNDKDLQTSVTDELACDPSIDAAHLVVSADDGVVTLSGHVASLPEHHAAKRGIAGVGRQGPRRRRGGPRRGWGRHDGC